MYKCAKCKLSLFSLLPKKVVILEINDRHLDKAKSDTSYVSVA